MQSVESIEIKLPKDVIESLEAAVASGQYHGASEIVLSALEQWRIRQRIMRDELGKLWDEGIASGWAEPFTLEELLAEAHARQLSK